MKRPLNHLELFAGIGGFSRAAELLYIDSGLEIPTIAYSEIDKFAVKTYQAIHPSSKYSLAMGDLIAWNKTKDYITRKLNPDYHTEPLRRITPTESFKLQGFTGHDVDLARQAGVSDTQLYKQIGNSYAVNMFYAVSHYLFNDQRIQEKQ